MTGCAIILAQSEQWRPKVTEAQKALVEKFKLENQKAQLNDWSMTKMLARDPQMLKNSGHKTLTDAVLHCIKDEAARLRKQDELLEAAGL